MRRRLGGSLAACAALLVLTAAKPGPAPDRVWAHPDLARLRPTRIAILPAASFVYLPRERAYVEDTWLQRFLLDRHVWTAAVLCRERMAATSRRGDSLLNAIEGQLRSRGRVDSTSSPGLARLLQTQALLCLRIDRWERSGEPRSTRIYIDFSASLVDSTGRLLWRASGVERLESVYGVPRTLSADQPTVPVTEPEYETWRSQAEAAQRVYSAGRPGEMGLGGAGPTLVAPDFHEAFSRILARWERLFPAAPPRVAAQAVH